MRFHTLASEVQVGDLVQLVGAWHEVKTIEEGANPAVNPYVTMECDRFTLRLHWSDGIEIIRPTLIEARDMDRGSALCLVSSALDRLLKSLPETIVTDPENNPDPIASWRP